VTWNERETAYVAICSVTKWLKTAYTRNLLRAAQYQRPRPYQPPPRTSSTMMMISSVVVSMRSPAGEGNVRTSPKRESYHKPRSFGIHPLSNDRPTQDRAELKDHTNQPVIRGPSDP
jgi:hypothetical protein